MQAATLSVLTGTFCIVTVFAFLQVNFSRLLAEWGSEVQLMVYLKEGLPEKNVESVRKFLSDVGEFESIRYVDKEEAAREFQKKLGSYAPDLLSDRTFGNPLPASFELKVKTRGKNYSRFNDLAKIADTIQLREGVDEVSYGQSWVDNYASLVKVFEISSIFLVFVLLAGSLFVIGNSIRSAIHERREEIEILELVGATARAIRNPFVFEGAIMGVLASALALASTFIIYSILQRLFSSEVGFWNLVGKIQFLSFGHSLLIIALGAVFGGLGAYICVRRLSTGWAAAERASR